MVGLSFVPSSALCGAIRPDPSSPVSCRVTVDVIVIIIGVVAVFRVSDLTVATHYRIVIVINDREHRVDTYNRVLSPEETRPRACSVHVPTTAYRKARAQEKHTNHGVCSRS